MSSVLIAGCGYLGSALGNELVARGFRVWGLRRNTRALPEGLQSIRADLTRPESLRGLPSGVDHVVYCAAPDRANDASYRSIYVEGLSNLIDALHDTAVSRFLFTSSTAVYEQDGGVWVDESTPARPMRFAGQRLLEAEQLLLARHPAPIVLRLAGIYGPGRTGLLDAVAQGRLTPSTGGPVYTNRIHQADCVGAIVHLLLHSSPERLYVGTDDEPVRRNEILEWLAKQLGPVAPCAPVASTWQHRQPSSNKRCSNARLRASGYALRYPSYREGYVNLMAERVTS